MDRMDVVGVVKDSGRRPPYPFSPQRFAAKVTQPATANLLA